MHSSEVRPHYLSGGVRPVKILVTGPFAVGKTTLVCTVSEIPPLRTEEVMTQAGQLVDDLVGVRSKTTTTVAIDFGRRTLPGGALALYLFGMAGQERFVPLWRDFAHGALGALVLADPRRVQDSFSAMSRLEEMGLPYAVAVNQFDDAPSHPEHEYRQAFDLEPATPLVSCDARDHGSVLRALIALVEYLLVTKQEAS
jgi:signal recognition particle receptor subunit beta